MGDAIRVLHVDDEKSFRNLTRRVLEEQNEQFTVETTADPSAVLDLLDEKRFHCLVVDYEMPGLDGIELLEAVRTEYADLPVILFTGKGSEEIASEAISAGVTDYLQKKSGTEQYELLANRIENAVSQYRTEQRLERKNDLFEKTQEIADLGAWEVDLQTDEGWWTEGVNQIYGLPAGYQPEPGEGIEYFHPDDRPTIQRAYERAVNQGKPYDLELRLKDEDRTVRWVRAMADPQTEDGEVICLRGILQNITERKQRQSVLKSLHSVATSIQTEKTVQRVCQQTVDAAVEILDLTLCTIVIRKGDWLVPCASSADTLPDGSRKVRISQGIAGKTYQTGESEIIDDAHENAEAEPARDTYRAAISVPIGDHGVFQAVSTEPGVYDAEDIEFAELLVSHTKSALDRIKREEELKRQNERLEEFASIVGHDLRNPLNVAQLQLHLARERGDNEHLESVSRAQDRMEALIDDLLALARAGKPVDEMEEVSLASVTRNCWRNVETGNATLAMELEGHVRADETRLQQLLENLVRNAIEHGTDTDEQESNVTVTVGQIDQEGFYVADDGPGIPEPERETIFESGYTTQQDGTGFGLAIVEDVVEAHDWEITVTEGADGGARFEITSVTFPDISGEP